MKYMNIKKLRCYIHKRLRQRLGPHIMSPTMNVIYEIEGDIDFFKELKGITTNKTGVSASASPSAVILKIEDKPVERCLITDENLRKDHITLKCGHKFNYVPLFKEVVFQKCSMLPKNVSSKLITTYVKNTPDSSVSSNVSTVLYNSSYNLETTKITYNEMKCPYCRAITPNILPYYPYPDVSRIKYVNSPADLALPAVSCEYNAKNTTAATICRMNCIYNEKYDMMLCNKHFNKLETDAAATAAAASVSTVKRQTRRGKTTTTTTTTTDTENVIISHHNPATTTCSFVLLSGPRKGCPCGKPMWIPKTILESSNTHTSDAAYCKVHYEKMYYVT